jgi:hypothetical protein
MSEERSSETINVAIDLLTAEKESTVAFLSTLNVLQNQRLTLIEHELQALRRKDEQDPRLNMLAENIEGAKHVVKAIINQLEISKISIPRIKEGEAIIHGRIIDNKGIGKEKCEISVVAEGEPVSIVGKSDQSGYYSIVLPSPVVKKMEGKDFEIYVRSKGFLIDKSSQPLKLEGHEVKYVAVIDNNKLKNVDAQRKAKKEGRKIRKTK